ncbi:MAG TPA: HEAT repeat domain-containing protein [Thermoanaerobaculia bacterium]|nr:HEAT repeat domain-containing protein [Thermoanaerobaculia bacterium]
MRALVAALALLITPAVLAQNALRDAASRDGAIAWKIATEGVQICCCDGGSTWNSRKNYVEYGEIYLVATMEKGRIDHLRMLEPTCPITARQIENVTADASLDFLRAHVTDDKRVVTAISMHQHPRVVDELIALARRHESTSVRREAIFWLGQKAGEKAAAELRAAVDDDPEDEVRERAVFAISQLPRERAVPLLVDLVKTHKRPVVRERAMFWLAQTGDERALTLIEEILGVK